MGVGPEGGAGGEHPHAGVAPQARGAHRGGPAVPHRLGELPDQPDVAEPLQPPQGVGIAVLRLKDHDAALDCPLCLGMPNLVWKSLRMWAIT